MGKSKVCPECGVLVSNLRKHKERGRCEVQHIRREDKQMMRDKSIPLSFYKQLKESLKKEREKDKNDKEKKLETS